MEGDEEMKAGRKLPVLRTVAIVIVVVTLIVTMCLLASRDSEAGAAATETPRPTLPPLTATCEVFLPIVEAHGPMPEVTPRPTLEVK
jgi:hypothetical protein